MAATPIQRDAVLHAIEGWPVEDQVALARAILERASVGQVENTAGKASGSTWDALYGIASSRHEPPSDEQVAQWLDEHKMEKYGQ
jgi:hypothetical protein